MGQVRQVHCVSGYGGAQEHPYRMPLPYRMDQKTYGSLEEAKANMPLKDPNAEQPECDEDKLKLVRRWRASMQLQCHDWYVCIHPAADGCCR